MPGAVRDPWCALRKDLRLIEPADVFRIRTCRTDTTDHRLRSVAVYLPRFKMRALPAAFVIPVARHAVNDGKACGGPLAVRDHQHSAKVWDFAEHVAYRLLDVTLDFRFRRAHQSAIITVRCPSEQFRMFHEQRIRRIDTGGFNAEHPHLYAVFFAPLNRATELCDTPVRIRRLFRERCLGDVAPNDGYPQPVDSLVRKTVEIRLGIVVHVIHQFITIERRAFDGTEEASRYAVLDPGLADAALEVSGTHPILIVIDSPSQPLVVLGGNGHLAILRNVDAVTFLAGDFSPNESHAVSRYGHKRLRPGKVLPEPPAFNSRVWRRSLIQLGIRCKNTSAEHRNRHR